MSDNVFDPGSNVMGDEGIPSSVVNLSARPSPYTEPQPRHRSGTSGANLDGGKANRGAGLISNAQGPAPCKFAVLYEQNAAVATEGQKNVRLMPRYAGDGGFWAKRSDS